MGRLFSEVDIFAGCRPERRTQNGRDPDSMSRKRGIRIADPVTVKRD